MVPPSWPPWIPPDSFSFPRGGYPMRYVRPPRGVPHTVESSFDGDPPISLPTSMCPPLYTGPPPISVTKAGPPFTCGKGCWPTAIFPSLFFGRLPNPFRTSSYCCLFIEIAFLSLSWSEGMFLPPPLPIPPSLKPTYNYFLPPPPPLPLLSPSLLLFLLPNEWNHGFFSYFFSPRFPVDSIAWAPQPSCLCSLFPSICPLAV